MSDNKQEKPNGSEIHVRIKPNGSLVQMITLDPLSLLECRGADNKVKHARATDKNKDN